MYIIYHIIIINSIINKCFNIVIIYNNVLINNPYSLRQKSRVFTELTVSNIELISIIIYLCIMLIVIITNIFQK